MYTPTKFTKLPALIILIVWTVIATGCATADMGYVTYASPDDWVQKTKSGPALPLANAADIWSEVKTYQTTNGPVGVQSKFIEQQATTCTFHVQFTNSVDKAIDENVSLTSAQKEKVYSHRFTRVQVPAGKTLYWEMEKRECALKWGTSKEMTKCAECAPQLVFLKN